MSIINDALRKAEQEGRSKSPLTHLLKKEALQGKYRGLKKALPAILSTVIVVLAFVLLYNVSQKRTNTRKANSGKNKPRTQAGASTLRGTGKPSVLSRLSKPAAATAKTRSKTPQRAQAGFSLNGIVFSEGESWAVINNKIVREGEAVGGARLVKIGKDFVELALPDKKLILKLN